MTTLTTPRRAERTSAYLPEPVRVREVTRLTELENRYTLTFEDGRALGHAPGQFVQVSIFGVGEAPISVCSSPTRQDRFELCVRRVGAVTERIHELKAGDVIGVRGPLGHGFEMDEFTGRDVLVVAGGLGLAPARSLIQYILDERDRFASFSLLYGTRSPAEILFRDDILAWERDPRVAFQMTVDKPDPQWRGKTGVVTTLFRHLPRPDPENTLVAVIGPPVMFKFVLLELLARGIPQKNVYCSLERRMKCGVGKCGHCQVNHVYVCMEGPVFKYGQLKALREALT